MLKSNMLAPLCDALAVYLGRLVQLGEDRLFIPLANMLSVVLSELFFTAGDATHMQWLVDITSYVVVVHIVDYLQSYLSQFVAPTADPAPAVLPAVSFLLALVHQPHYTAAADRAGLLYALRDTDVGGVIPLLYAVLFHPNAPKPGSELPVTVQSVVYVALKTLNWV